MQSKGRLILLLGVGILVTFAAVAIYSHLSSGPQPVAASAPASTRVLVARHDIAPGSFVQSPQDVDWDVLPDGTPSQQSIQENAAKLSDFNGSVARRELHAGEAVPPSALMKSGEGGFMSAVLEPGMRAVSIPVTATSGNAGFISPGDHVDLIVTHRFKENNASNTESVLGETFVHDVRVVAIDQMLDNPDNKAILAKTVTVEVSSRQAEQIAVAEEMGKISVALRSLTNSIPIAQKSGVVAQANSNMTRDSDISKALHENVSPRVRVIRGDQTENVQLY